MSCEVRSCTGEIIHGSPQHRNEGYQTTDQDIQNGPEENAFFIFCITKLLPHRVL